MSDPHVKVALAVVLRTAGRGAAGSTARYAIESVERLGTRACTDQVWSRLVRSLRI
jgi:hypothetical protein